MGRKRTFEFDGLGVSPGIAVGPAYVIEPQSSTADPIPISADEVEAEIERFRHAVLQARQEIAAIGRRVSEAIDSQQAAIFDAHDSMLSDPYLIGITEQRIRNEQLNCEYVFSSVARGITEQLSALDDEYLNERNFDLHDVARRVLKFLARMSGDDAMKLREGSIVIAQDLGPAETADLHHARISAFCTNEGGGTSHTAILARSLGIPAVVGLELVTYYVRTGQMVVVDGTRGKMILNPNPDQLAEYERRQERYLEARHELEKFRDLPAETVDGCRITMLANIDFHDEIAMAESHGAEGVGLYRTEFLFLESCFPPDEERQHAVYRDVLDRVAGPVTLRTLDVGGDKLPDFRLGMVEQNPFLGMRAIRLCLRFPELLRCQLRPLLKAAAGRELRLMIPMVTSIEEVQQTRAILEEVGKEICAEGHVPPSKLELGVMIEVPSAAILAPVLARHCDFFSIGSNDLTQYVLAVDRVSSAVAHLYSPLHPAVLNLIQTVIHAGRDHHTSVCICGEMAGDPVVAQLLVGMGIRQLSMSPVAIPNVKRGLRMASLEDLEEAAGEALMCSTTAEVMKLLRAKLPYQDLFE